MRSSSGTSPRRARVTDSTQAKRAPAHPDCDTDEAALVVVRLAHQYADIGRHANRWAGFEADQIMSTSSCGVTSGSDTHLSANWPPSERLSPSPPSGLGPVGRSVVVVSAVRFSPVGGGSSGSLVVLVPSVAGQQQAGRNRYQESCY